MLGSKQGHLFDIFICNVGRDDQDGWIGVAQLIGAVDLSDGPALIWKALEKQMLMCFGDILKYLSSHTNHQKAVLKRVSPSWIGRNPDKLPVLLQTYFTCSYLTFIL